MEINNASRTEHKRLYQHTYWGGFGYLEEDAPIIQNRNVFAEAYGLVKHVRKGKVPQYIERHLGHKDEWSLPTDPDRQKHRIDHTEVYKDKYGNFVLVNSPYHHYEPEFVEQWGWTEIDPLYNDHAKTLVKIVSPKDRQLYPERRRRWQEWMKEHRHG